MKTFEGHSTAAVEYGTEDWRVIFSMYILRAIAASGILLLLFYIVERLESMLQPIPTFPEFIMGNPLVFCAIFAFLLVIQLLVYTYRTKKGISIKRSRGELIINYALPIVGIIGTVYAAYALGIM